MPDNEPTEAEIEAAARALHSSTPNGNTGLLTRHGVRMALLAARRVSSVPSFADGIKAAAKYAAKLRDDSRLEPMEFSEIAKGIRALAHNPQASSGGATHRHKKRGAEYELIGYGRMQADNWIDKRTGKSVDMEEVAMYRSVDDGSLWPRPREEFEDGRFEVLK